KVIGTFEHEKVKYDKLTKRDFLINCGTEQALAYLLGGKGSVKLRNYMKNVQGITDKKFLNWVEHIEFKGDVYGMSEGTIFFAQESQLRVHERFEEAQVYESLLLSTLNPQTNVCTTANDIFTVAPGKILLEGGSRRAGSPQAALFNSRAARCGGFTASSNVAYGMAYDEKVGGTHGHSYVMLHPSEYAAFKAQAKMFKGTVCFLVDTYNVKNAFETALKIVQEEKLTNFGFRIDSGDLLAQAKWIHQEMKTRGYQRKDYTLVASDDLTAGKIARLEKEGADIDKYLVGTYVVNPPKPLGGVYKLAAFQEADGSWNLRGKLSEEFSKSTLPGIKQVCRVMGNDGYYKKDVIAFEGEDLVPYLQEGDSAEALLVPMILQGKLVYDCLTINEISQRRVQQLSKFKDIANYEVVISAGIIAKQKEIMQQYGLQGGK
ncbi:MAG: hypothetical protein AABY26_01035, partial [Nanoarchaeota archaeon]